MTHDVHHMVVVTVRTDDTALLDSVESEFPASDLETAHHEYDGPQRETEGEQLEAGEERLTGRVTFADTASTSAESYASGFYDAVTAYDFSEATYYEVKHYISPVGGTTVADVREWYEQHPDQQPTDENGDSYIPDVWNPDNHIIGKDSG